MDRVKLIGAGIIGGTVSTTIYHGMSPWAGTLPALLVSSFLGFMAGLSLYA